MKDCSIVKDGYVVFGVGDMALVAILILFFGCLGRLCESRNLLKLLFFELSLTILLKLVVQFFHVLI